ncbi:MAG: proline dehydrogenase, partial [Bacteroidota bacterium]
MDTKLQPHISFENTSVAFSAKNNRELKRMYWLFLLLNNKLLVGLGSSLVNLALFLRFPVRWIIRPTVFRQFCGGESIKECENTIQNLSKDRVGTILDFSVE